MGVQDGHVYCNAATLMPSCVLLQFTWVVAGGEVEGGVGGVVGGEEDQDVRVNCLDTVRTTSMLVVYTLHVSHTSCFTLYAFSDHLQFSISIFIL